jgi:mycofactocin biosynthesis protein MftB
VSTEAARAGFDLDAAWRLHPQVSVRPERFGALLYHFGTRRLSFLKSPELLTVVRTLDTQPSARAACAAAGLGGADLPAYTAALATLAAGSMITSSGGRAETPAQAAPTAGGGLRTEATGGIRREASA